MTAYDEMPPEVRREMWGWFGPPWWSYVCYDENGLLIEEMRKPFPHGEACLLCGVPFEPGDSGQASPVVRERGPAEIRHVHTECQYMSVTGSLAHHQRRCSCYGGDGGTPGLSYRAEAVAVWRQRRTS